VTIQDLGSIGELIAAIATIVTLVYLAVQIRSNTRALAVDSARSFANIGDSITTAVANNGELAEIFHRGLGELGSLNEVEKIRFSFVVGQLITTCRSAWHESAITGDQNNIPEALSGISFLRASGGREWWRENSNLFGTEFGPWLEHSLNLDTPPTARPDPSSDSA
jgi:hypothetical protein